ncbi:MAG TPA: hypothetical protein VGU69_05050 [Rhizomicrobium sp.]|nr:hypothetical protein [Rhizomicrobium sp.]
MAAKQQKFGRAAKAAPKKKHTIQSRISDIGAAISSAFGKGKPKKAAKPAPKRTGKK